MRCAWPAAESRKPDSDFNGLNHEDAVRQSQKLHRCGFSAPCLRAAAPFGSHRSTLFYTVLIDV